MGAQDHQASVCKRAELGFKSGHEQSRKRRPAVVRRQTLGLPGHVNSDEGPAAVHRHRSVCMWCRGTTVRALLHGPAEPQQWRGPFQSESQGRGTQIATVTKKSCAGAKNTVKDLARSQTSYFKRKIITEY